MINSKIIFLILLPFAFLFGNRAIVLYETDITGFSLIVSDGLGGFYLYNEIDEEIIHFNGKIKKIDRSISLDNENILSDLERNGSELIAGTEEQSQFFFYSSKLEYSGKVPLLHDNHEFYSTKIIPTKSRRLFIQDEISNRLFIYYDNSFQEIFYNSTKILGTDKKRDNIIAFENNSVEYISDIGGKQKKLNIDSIPKFNSFVMDSVFLYFPKDNIINEFQINTKSVRADTLESNIIDFNFDLNGIYILTEFKVYYLKFRDNKSK